MKKIYAFAAFGLTASLAFGQVTDLGGPMTSHDKVNLHPVLSIEEMPQFNLQQVIEANAANAAEKIGPYMFGYEHLVSHNLDNSGEWETLNNGARIWRIKYKSNGALSLNFVFTDFKMPEGASVHIYNEDKSMVEGAYTSANNSEHNTLGTDLIKGEVAIIEYYEPKDVAGQGRLQVGMVVHGYKDINGWYPNKVNESGACNLDVICPDGAPWDMEIRSVARILNGGGLCTGTLIADVPQSGTPYFLTADHCGPQSMGSAVFRFNYNSTVCGSQTSANSVAPTQSNNVNGSTFRAANSYSDFGLIELSSVPPVSYNATFAGWDNSGATPSTAVGIHHPSGDVKKISFDDDALQNTGYGGGGGVSHWRIEAWERNTTTEGGSSGSGLWDQNHRIVGQLHGGQANCSNSVNDYYGAFHHSWDGNGASQASQRLSDWLDPQNTGATTVDGYDPNAPTVSDDAGFQGAISPTSSQTSCSNVVEPVITLKNYGSNTLTSCTINFNIDGGANIPYNWTGSLATNQSEDVTLPSQFVSGSGSHTFNATVTDPNGTTDGNASNDDLSVTFIAFPNSQGVDLSLDLDCYGDEIDWEITEQGSTTVLYSGSGYTNQAGGYNVVEEMCLPDGCYTFTINDSYGDGLNGAAYTQCGVDGNYQIVGEFGDNYVTMGSADFGNSTSHDFCINDTGIEEELLNVTLYPNPAEGMLSIYGEQLLNAELTIFDANGKLVLSQLVSHNDAVNIENLAKGIYVVKVTSNQGIKTEKLIKK